MASGETNRRLLRRRPFEPALCVLIIIRAVIGVVLLETATATASSANRVERLSRLCYCSEEVSRIRLSKTFSRRGRLSHSESTTCLLLAR